MRNRFALPLSLACCLLAASPIVAAPTKPPPAPPSSLNLIVDQQAIGPSQQISLPIEVAGWQSFTLFVEAFIVSPPGGPEASGCVSVGALNGLGENLAPSEVVLGGSGDSYCQFQPSAGIPPVVPRRGFLSSALVGPNLVVTVVGASDLTVPAIVSVWLYLH